MGLIKEKDQYNNLLELYKVDQETKKQNKKRGKMVAIAIGAVAAVSLVVAGIVNRYKLFDYREYMDQTFLINAPITVNIDNIYDQLYFSQDSDDSRATINVNYYDVVDQPEYQFYSTTLSNNVLSISQSDNKPFFSNDYSDYLDIYMTDKVIVENFDINATTDYISINDLKAEALTINNSCDDHSSLYLSNANINQLTVNQNGSVSIYESIFDDLIINVDKNSNIDYQTLNLYPVQISHSLLINSQIDDNWIQIAGRQEDYDVYHNGTLVSECSNETSCKIIEINANYYEISFTEYDY